MKITVNEERRVTPKTVILGICGEVGVRSIEIDAPTVSGAVLYVMRFAVPSGVVYETEISGGSVTVPAAVLAETGCGLMQWVARSSTGQLIAKSETVGYAVMQSVGDETSTLPAPEDTQSAIDRIKEVADEAIGSISGLVPEDGSIQEVIDARTGCFSDYTYASLQQRLNAELGSCVRQNAFEQNISNVMLAYQEADAALEEIIQANAEKHSTLANTVMSKVYPVAFSAYDAAGLNRKNLLKITRTSELSINGLTFVLSSDGCVTANGTATADTQFVMHIEELPANGPLTLSGCPEGGITGQSYALHLMQNTAVLATDSGSGMELIPDLAARATSVAIEIFSGYTAANLVFRPMIRRYYENDAFASYTPTLQEQIDLNQESVESNTASISKNAALTASTLGTAFKKNLLKNTASTVTTNGVTFTVNSDGSVTANGTATEAAFFNIPYKHTGEARAVILSGCPEGGNGETYMMRADKAGTIVARDYGSGTTMTADEIASVTYVAIRINAGYTADNLTFYPMIRYADISDGTYEPYTPSLQEQIDELKAQIAAMTAAATNETEE